MKKIKKLLKIQNPGLPEDFQATDEFRNLVTEIESTTSNFFITGEAGTGKTTLLKYLRQNTKKNVVVLAPTGIAAINSQGQTIHSFFYFPHTFIQDECIEKIVAKRKIFSKLDVLIIDEVSMVRADLMDGVDKALRINRERKDQPFGGVQIVLFGDLCQLPPILKRELEPAFKKVYDSEFFPSAKVFKDNIFLFHGRKLYEIHRQQDKQFQELLRALRTRSLDTMGFSTLNMRCAPELINSIEDCITLTPTNHAADSINKEQLEKLKSKEFLYSAKITGQFEQESYPTKKDLRLKVGAQVLMIKNDPSKRWVNGSIVQIAKLKDDSIKVRIKDEICDVEPTLWEKFEYEYDGQIQKIVEKPVGSFEQYPIRLAWAITIHKSQGLTFDKVMVDLGSGTFTSGQLYVAISRCRNLKGLFLKRPIRYEDMILDDRITQLLNDSIMWDKEDYYIFNL